MRVVDTTEGAIECGQAMNEAASRICYVVSESPAAFQAACIKRGAAIRARRRAMFRGPFGTWHLLNLVDIPVGAKDLGGLGTLKDTHLRGHPHVEISAAFSPDYSGLRGLRR